MLGTASPATLGALERLNGALLHRGPDDEGVWADGPAGVALGHRRLAIVDLTPTGRQPMISSSGRFVLAFNGEIYNFRELQRELASAGQVFRGTSDTEVLLAAFEVWGMTEALRRANGMFAGALWDRRGRRLFLFRDRLGVKPLYYLWARGSLWFSSEMTVPFAGLSRRTVDRVALAQYFRHNCVPAPRSIYEGVFKLMPGTLAFATRDDASRGEFGGELLYWNVVDEAGRAASRKERPRSQEEATELLDDVLRRSVAQHMISDVPLGAFLSGGIDSSLLVSYMQRESTQRVRTFTIGFPERDHDEAVIAEQVAKCLGTEHTTFYVSEHDAAATVPRLPAMFGEPFADASQVPTFLVSQLTRQAVTVAMSGDAGDELFGGYRHHWAAAKLERWAGRFPAAVAAGAVGAANAGPVRRIVRRALGDRGVQRLSVAARLLAGAERENVAGALDVEGLWAEALLDAAAGATRVGRPAWGDRLADRLMHDDLVFFLPDDVLVKVDRASMATSLEVRAPFADDWHVLEAAWMTPVEFKVGPEGGKLVLKRLLSRFVPLSVVRREKHGFTVPLLPWLNGELRDWVGDVASSSAVRAGGMLRWDPVREAREGTARGEDASAARLWTICLFQSWLADLHSRVVAERVQE
ncbi:MAG: asparagine synthase (glutamine-hydrolyzing) [Deltaproteobacteria bacterium]|nr:asparagine synthase (glutamine-hydrolyzing) [Deltaproteobacteria bacterium]